MSPSRSGMNHDSTICPPSKRSMRISSKAARRPVGGSAAPPGMLMGPVWVPAPRHAVALGDLAEQGDDEVGKRRSEHLRLELDGVGADRRRESGRVAHAPRGHEPIGGAQITMPEHGLVQLL